MSFRGMTAGRTVVVMAMLLCAAAGTAQPAFYHVINRGDLPGGYDHSNARGVNNAGQAVGLSCAATGDRAFLWSSSTGMLDLGDLPNRLDNRRTI